MKVVIVGAGNMGLAMAQGLKSSGFSVTLAGRASPKLQSLSSEFETEIIGDNYDINGKNIILAIKPNALKWFSNVIIGKANLIISVLARTSLDQIQTLSSAAHAICLPNQTQKDDVAQPLCQPRCILGERCSITIQIGHVGYTPFLGSRLLFRTGGTKRSLCLST